jgi:hypothetical protein
MGCYDIVRVPCPTCGEVEYFQSKGGSCTLTDYYLDDAPADVMMDVNRHSPHTCRKCGTLFRVATQYIVVAKSVVHAPDEEDE